MTGKAVVLVFAATRNIVASDAGFSAANNLAALFSTEAFVDRFAPKRAVVAAVIDARSPGTNERKVSFEANAAQALAAFDPETLFANFDLGGDDGDGDDGTRTENYSDYDDDDDDDDGGNDLSHIRRVLENGSFPHYDRELNLSIFDLLIKMSPALLAEWHAWQKINQRPLFPDYVAKFNLIDSSEASHDRYPLLQAMNQIFQLEHETEDTYDELKDAISDLIGNRRVETDPADINSVAVREGIVILNFLDEILKKKTEVRDAFQRKTGQVLEVIPSKQMIWCLSKAVHAVRDTRDPVNKNNEAAEMFSRETMDFLFRVAEIDLDERTYPESYTSSCRGAGKFTASTGEGGYIDVGENHEDALDLMNSLADDLDAEEARDDDYY